MLGYRRLSLLALTYHGETFRHGPRTILHCWLVCRCDPNRKCPSRGDYSHWCLYPDLSSRVLSWYVCIVFSYIRGSQKVLRYTVCWTSCRKLEVQATSCKVFTRYTIVRCKRIWSRVSAIHGNPSSQEKTLTTLIICEGFIFIWGLLDD